MPDFDARSYWERRLRGHYSLHGVGHLRLGRHFNNWMYRLRRHVFLQRMRGTGLDFSRFTVLDVGAGTGFYVDRWTELGVRDIVGVDLTEVATQALRQRYPHYTFYRVDIGDSVQVLQGRAFDAVSCFDVLFHIVDDDRFERAVENVASLLKSGGLFVFSDGFVHPEAMERSIQVPHRVSRSLDYVQDVLKRNGFQIVERRPMFYLLSEPVDTRSPIARLRWALSAGPAAVSNTLGYVVGAALYPIERVLVSRMTESPAIEMMICRRTA
jgi:SAM-dependent methyltransferase